MSNANPYFPQQQFHQQPAQFGGGANPYLGQAATNYGYATQQSMDPRVLFEQYASTMLQDLANSGRSSSDEINYIHATLTNRKMTLLQEFAISLGANQSFMPNQLEGFIKYHIDLMREAFRAMYQNRPATPAYGSASQGLFGQQSIMDTSFDVYRDPIPTPPAGYSYNPTTSQGLRDEPIAVSGNNCRVLPPTKEQTQRPVEVNMGAIEEIVTLRRTNPEDDQQMQTLLTVPECQTCTHMASFRDDDNRVYHAVGMDLLVPYTDSDLAMEDIHQAYPQLLEIPKDGGYAHMFTFNRMAYAPQNYDELTPLLDNLAVRLMEDPFSIAQGLRQLPILIRKSMEMELIRDINIGLVTKLGVPTNQNKLFYIKIGALEDLEELRQASALPDSAKLLLELGDYESTLMNVVKSAVSTFFDNRLHATPYLELKEDSEDLTYAVRYEGSGIRVQNGVGRQLIMSGIGDESYLKGIIAQLKRRTCILQRTTMLQTDLILPEAKSNPRANYWIVNSLTAPLHTLLNSLTTRSDKIIQLDMRNSMGRQDIYVGRSRANSLIFATRAAIEA